LRAGVPQVVLPSAFDQFDNAMRIERLGVGRSMPMKRVQAQALGALLSAVLDSQAVQDRCREAAEQVQVSRSRERACECVEALLTPQPNPSP
jgi:UDP:flavonoid glycosyltransferase YjiC (YdhE family)